MLNKIISIRNVGRFVTCKAGGDVAFARCNLVFAENGRGKSTLCAILRSLQTGDPDHIVGRATLGLQEPPEIELLLDGATVRFANGSWSTTAPELAIFDSTFVSDNVYSGDIVGLDNKRNLYRLVIGKQGVEYVRTIEDLDRAIRDKSAEIREKLAAVRGLVPKSMEVEAYLRLVEDPSIEAKIVDQESSLRNLQEADRIAGRSSFLELLIPEFPAEFEALLRRSIRSVVADAAERVTQQIEAHSMHERGEIWLSEGLRYVSEDACPFCGQQFDDDAKALIAAYRDYFSASYDAIRADTSAMRTLIEDRFSDREAGRAERTLDQNANSVEFWSQYLSFGAPPVTSALGTIDTVFRAVRGAAVAALETKAAAPLEPVSPSPAFRQAQGALVSLRADMAKYNFAVQIANANIAAQKAKTAGSSISVAESALTRLRAIRERHAPEGSAICIAYEQALNEKRALESQKESAKRELERLTSQLLHKYESNINTLLSGFNAGFRLAETSHGYPGGIASSSYKVVINDTAVELGDDATPLSQPCFRNTLSSGDKSTLALAFFLAQLECDLEKDAKTVVFDDPFNSQDSFRKEHTIQRIKDCGRECKQAIVLSHDQLFLRRIWDALADKPAERKCLKLSRVGLRNTTITCWDVEEATQANVVTDRSILVQYYNTATGAPRTVATKIRPVLESHCRSIRPEEFPKDSLGIIVGKVRSAGETHPLYRILPDLDELDGYACRYHHADSPIAAPASIDETELQGYVKRTLEIVGWC